MGRRERFRKAEARCFIAAMAAGAAEIFALPAIPDVSERIVDRPRSFDLRFEVDLVWTRAGAARMALDVSATFAHLYFRFHDPARALAAGLDDGGRLNRYSGKWNNWHAPDPEVKLRHFEVELLADWRRVADPSPDPETVAAHIAAQEAERARFAAALRELTKEKEPT